MGKMRPERTMGWGGILRTWLFTITYKGKQLEGLSRGLIRSDFHLKMITLQPLWRGRWEWSRTEDQWEIPAAVLKTDDGGMEQCGRDGDGWKQNDSRNILC